MKVLIVQCNRKSGTIVFPARLINDRFTSVLRAAAGESVFGIVNGCVITINVLLCILNVFPLPNVIFANIAILSGAESNGTNIRFIKYFLYLYVHRPCLYNSKKTEKEKRNMQVRKKAGKKIATMPSLLLIIEKR